MPQNANIIKMTFVRLMAPLLDADRPNKGMVLKVSFENKLVARAMS